MHRPQLFQKRIESLLHSRQSDLVIVGAPSAQRQLLYINPLVKAFEASTTGLPRALVMAPTKEQIDRIAFDFNSLRDKRASVVSACSGESDKQYNMSQLHRGCDFLLGTPGRLHWLFKQGGLVGTSVETVVLEQADLLLTSPLVVELLSAAVPKAQRVICTSNFDRWLTDTLADISRPGHAMTSIKIPSKFIPSDSVQDHQYSRVSTKEESRQIRSFVDTWMDESANVGKAVVILRNKVDVGLLAGEGLFDDWLSLNPDMSSKVKQQQVTKFNTAQRCVILTTESALASSSLTGVGLVVCLGNRRSADEYLGLSAKFPAAQKIVTLMNTTELSRFNKWRPQSGIAFKVAHLTSPDDLTVSFAKSVLANNTLPTPGHMVDLTTKLIKMHGPGLVAGLVSLLESRKSISLERRSPLSGLTGFSPVLLFDPFQKKIRNYETVDKLLKAAVNNSRAKFGRIALSSKGFVADIPHDLLNSVVSSKRLALRNIRVIPLRDIPPLVANDRLFLLKQTVRDRKSFGRFKS